MAAMRVVLALGLVAACSSVAAPGPINRVIELIEELRVKVEADGKAEQKMYDKYACWCEVTTQRTADSIHQAVADIKTLGSKILEMKGAVATAVSEVAEHAKLMAENQKSQDEATAIREKNNGQYSSEKAEMEQTLGSLEQGIKSLAGAGTKAALLQMSRPKDEFAVLKMGSAVHEAVQQLPASHRLSPAQLSALAAFTRDPAEYYDKKAQKKESYNPASATIQGILKSMYDTFAMSLERSTEMEATQAKNYETLMGVKKKEMATLSSARTKIEEEKADNEKTLADASQDLDNTQTAMKADILFFDDTKKQCQSNAVMWQERVRARTEEMAGINKALEILNSDDSKATFDSAIKPGMETSLLQVQSEQAHSPRDKAYRALKRTARKSGSMRLAALAASVKETGHFPQVIAEVDKMIANLKQEEKDDYEHKDWCKEETFKNEQEASRFEYKIEKIDAEIAKLKAHIEQMEAVRADTLQQMRLTRIDVRKMTDERAEEHQTFQQTKADDEAAVKLLASAIEALGAFYKNNAALLQRKATKQAPVFDRSENQAPELTFSKSTKSSGEAGGIVATMTMIKEDLEAEIANGVKEEEEAQVEFEASKAAAEKLLKDLELKEIDLSRAIADDNSQVDVQAEERADQDAGLKEEQEYLWSIKPDCEWIFRAFDTRREKRAMEIDGLLESKGMLQGAETDAAAPAPALVQEFDDSSFPRMKFLGLGAQ